MYKAPTGSEVRRVGELLVRQHDLEAVARARVRGASYEQVVKELPSLSRFEAMTLWQAAGFLDRPGEWQRDTYKRQREGIRQSFPEPKHHLAMCLLAGLRLAAYIANR